MSNNPLSASGPCMLHGRCDCPDCFYLDANDDVECDCWHNPETGYLEPCPKHEAEFMDQMMEREALVTRALDGPQDTDALRGEEK